MITLTLYIINFSIFSRLLHHWSSWQGSHVSTIQLSIIQTPMSIFRTWRMLKMFCMSKWETIWNWIHPWSNHGQVQTKAAGTIETNWIWGRFLRMSVMKHFESLFFFWLCTSGWSVSFNTLNTDRYLEFEWNSVEILFAAYNFAGVIWFLSPKLRVKAQLHIIFVSVLKFEHSNLRNKSDWPIFHVPDTQCHRYLSPATMSSVLSLLLFLMKTNF